MRMSQLQEKTFYNLRRTFGKKLPEAMLNFYLKYNGGQSCVSGVHDDKHLFPFNAFYSLEEMEKALNWFDDEVVPAGFQAKDLLHFAYDPGSGNYALSLREEELWQGLLLCFRRKS